MIKREFTRWAMASGVVVALCVASSLEAQVDTTRRDTTARARSDQRIPIRKESRGDVALPSTRSRADSIRADSVARASQARNDSIMATDRARNDSIMAAERARTDSLNLVSRQDSIAQAARTDSIARMEQARTDSISRAEHARADSIARVDSVAGANIVTDQQFTVPGRTPGAFYWGIGGGAAAPTGDLEDLGYDSGLNISIPIGWHAPSNMFGFRLLLGYNQLNGSTFLSGGAAPITFTNPDPTIYSAEAGLTMRFPFGANRMSSLYLVGGGGLYMFRSFGANSALGAYLGNDVLEPEDEANESTISKWGVNAGAGFEFGIGRGALFLESRMVNVFTGRGDEVNFDNVFGARGTTARWVPLIIGVTMR
jgi:hypothetical protein